MKVTKTVPHIKFYKKYMKEILIHVGFEMEIDGKQEDFYYTDKLSIEDILGFFEDDIQREIYVKLKEKYNGI